LAGFTGVNKHPVLHEKFDRTKPDMAPIIPKLMKADAQAVLFIGSGNMVADGVKLLRSAGSRAQVVTLSNNASAGFVKSLGDNARGTVVSQVFPYERSLSAPIVKEALEYGKAAGVGEVTPAMLEGYAAAKVLVEGLRRAGANPTRDKLIKALESMTSFDLGGITVGYGPKQRVGSRFVDVTVIGSTGKLLK